MQCPMCSGTLKSGKLREVMFGVDLGEFPAEICTKCGESFTDEATTALIKAAAKRKGVWGLGRKAKVTKTGNSIAVRIPKEIAGYLKLKPGTETYIHPEGKNLVIEGE